MYLLGTKLMSKISQGLNSDHMYLLWTKLMSCISLRDQIANLVLYKKGILSF